MKAYCCLTTPTAGVIVDGKNIWQKCFDIHYYQIALFLVELLRFNPDAWR